MSQKDLILFGAIGIAAYILLPKLKAHAAGPAISRSAPINNNNMNDDMWKRILGGAWSQFTDAQTIDGGLAFLKKNIFGQVTSSDGTPISQGDPVADWLTANTGLPNTYGNELGLTVSDLTGAPDRTDPMAGFRNPNDYFHAY